MVLNRLHFGSFFCWTTILALLRNLGLNIIEGKISPCTLIVIKCRSTLGLEVLRRRFPIQSRVAANGRHHFGGRDGDGDDDDGGGASRMRTRVSLLLRRRRRLTRMRSGFHFHSAGCDGESGYIFSVNLYRVVQKKSPPVSKFPPQCCQATWPAHA